MELLAQIKALSAAYAAEFIGVRQHLHAHIFYHTRPYILPRAFPLTPLVKFH